MQPSALSVEPLIMASALAFLIVVLPISFWIGLKWPPKVRGVAIIIGLVGLVFVAFNLGRMTGLSMAWYHWKREYKEPMWEWQITMRQYTESQDTNGLMRMAERFNKENIQAYGREKLFEKGKFRNFVEGLSKPEAIARP